MMTMAKNHDLQTQAYKNDCKHAWQHTGNRHRADTTNVSFINVWCTVSRQLQDNQAQCGDLAAWNTEIGAMHMHCSTCQSGGRKGKCDAFTKSTEAMEMYRNMK
jgi:hypothetical protein